MFLPLHVGMHYFYDGKLWLAICTVFVWQIGWLEGKSCHIYAWTQEPGSCWFVNHGSCTQIHIWSAKCQSNAVWNWHLWTGNEALFLEFHDGIIKWDFLATSDEPFCMCIYLSVSLLTLSVAKNVRLNCCYLWVVTESICKIFYVDKD